MCSASRYWRVNKRWEDSSFTNARRSDCSASPGASNSRCIASQTSRSEPCCSHSCQIRIPTELRPKYVPLSRFRTTASPLSSRKMTSSGTRTASVMDRSGTGKRVHSTIATWMSARDAIFIFPDFRDRQWCDRIRAAMERGERTPAEVQANGFVVDREVRRTLEVDVDSTTVEEVERSIVSVCERVARFFRIPLSDDEGPGFLRYVAGGFYRRHFDLLSDWYEEFPRLISVVIFLMNAGEQCEGGSLRLYRPEAFDIAPKAGTLVAFPSKLPHEVLSVTAGVQDVVVDWFFYADLRVSALRAMAGPP